MENRLDGNAAAGMMQTIFPFDVTMIEGICANCDATVPLGATAVYMNRMGMIMRCPTCNNTLIRLSFVKGRYMLDMQGMRVLEIRTEANPFPETVTP